MFGYSEPYKLIIALLYISLFSIDCQPRSLNMSTDGVRKSAFNIILAARFCNFRSRSRFEEDVEPQITEP